MEELWIKDLDNWLCNLYFEVDIVKLMDLKYSEETEGLYFHPPFAINTKLRDRAKQTDRMQRIDDL